MSKEYSTLKNFCPATAVLYMGIYFKTIMKTDAPRLPSKSLLQAKTVSTEGVYFPVKNGEHFRYDQTTTRRK